MKQVLNTSLTMNQLQAIKSTPLLLNKFIPVTASEKMSLSSAGAAAIRCARIAEMKSHKRHF